MSNVTPLRPSECEPTCRYGYTSAQALELFAELVSDSSRILPTQHAYQRMDEREVTMSQVLQVLRRGRRTEEPRLSEWTTWSVSIRADTAGQDVSVVAVIDQDSMGNMIAVVTVITHRTR